MAFLASELKAQGNKITGLGPGTNASDAVTKSQLDAVSSAITTGILPPTPFNASASPNYPAATQPGESHIISIGGAGRVGGASGIEVGEGDTFYALDTGNPSDFPLASGDQATVGNRWAVLEGNRGTATETEQGLVRIATAVEAVDPANDTTVLTPERAQNLINANIFLDTIGDGASTTFVITHNLNTATPSVEIVDVATEEPVILPPRGNITTSAFDLTFNPAPPATQYRVKVRK